MLNFVENQTDLFIQSVNKEDRKNIGQFFTTSDVAKFMAELFYSNKKHLDILDPGAGSGILSAAIISHLENSSVESINLTLCENNSKILPLLHKNMEYIKKNSTLTLNYKILDEDYILDNSFMDSTLDSSKKVFDFIIANPPYLKISKNSPEAKSMESICYGSPNMYFLFMAMALSQLKEDSEMVFIIPRSWTSGAYFVKFRKYLLKYGKIKHIHLFINRNNVFENESVLQETIIIHIAKSKKPLDFVKITSSSNNDFSKLDNFKVPYNLAISKDINQFVYLPTNKKEIEIINKVHNFDNSLIDLGLKLKTGLTVGFRNKELLEETANGENVPLFYPFHFKDNLIIFPVINDKKQFINKSKKGLIQKNKNYLLIKRFTSKEEKRRIQSAIYLKENFNQFDYISTDNKLNFIEHINNEELTKEEVYGLFVIFNSTLYDKYYRLLNGSTQVNANEINSIPIPSRKEIVNLGKILLDNKNLSVDTCDKILETIL